MAVNALPIAIVGCGPGSPQYLTDAARQAVAGAEVLLGSRRLLELFDDCRCRRVEVGGDVAAIMEQIAAHHEAGQRVVVLVSGDPGLFSLGRNIVERFGRENCEVIAAVSSVQAAFARLGLDWGDALIISATAGGRRLTPRSLPVATSWSSWAARRKPWSGRPGRRACWRPATTPTCAKT